MPESYRVTWRDKAVRAICNTLINKVATRQYAAYVRLSLRLGENEVRKVIHD